MTQSLKECDIGKVEPLLDLLNVPPASRDDSWRKEFYSTVIDASFRCETPQVFTGLDGFPYFSLLSPEPLKPFDSFCICNIVEVATDNGFGIAINRRRDGADWVFTYGELLWFRLNGTFEGPQTTAEAPKRVHIEKEERALIGTPSETYLPSYARAAIRSFMQHSLGIKDAKVFLMYRVADSQPMQLVFSVYPEQFKTEGEYFNVLRLFTWFLPRHYSVTGIPMASDMCKNFVPL